MSLNETPTANRLHIAFFGRTNSGKSTLMNKISGQEASLVSPVAGTTTDPVYRNMEIHPIGPCALIDTAGFDDKSPLGEKRLEQTKKVLDKTDVAVLLLSEGDNEQENEWYDILNEKNIPVIVVQSKSDNENFLVNSSRFDEVLRVSGATGEGLDGLKNKIAQAVPDFFEVQNITGHLIEKDDVVLLVMPQDIQAPKGRLILPQVQTIRDVLDRQCVCVCATLEQMERALASLKKPPKLIITDSQVFFEVYNKKPEESILTSFSVLFARYKGDLKEFVKGAETVDRLTEKSRVLIAEACSHNALDEDIGRVKIPALLRKKVGSGLEIDVVAGSDFPEDLKKYDLVIHCGGCMFNRKHIISRTERAKEQGVPITNYGVVIAKLKGILEKIDLTY